MDTQNQTSYRIAPGDYLALIAQKVYGSEDKWSLIYQANRGQIGDDPTKLVVGMVLVIPSDAGPNAPSTGDLSTAPQRNELLSAAEGNAMAVAVARLLMHDFGLNQAQAAGVLGNLWLESAGMNSNINQIYGFEGRGGPGAPSSDMNQGYGFCQWSYDRKRAYLGFCEREQRNPASPAANYAFLSFELRNTETTTIPALRGTQTPEDAATAFRREFERAEQPHDEGRAREARRIFGLL